MGKVKLVRLAVYAALHCASFLASWWAGRKKSELDGESKAEARKAAPKPKEDDDEIDRVSGDCRHRTCDACGADSAECGKHDRLRYQDASRRNHHRRNVLPFSEHVRSEGVSGEAARRKGGVHRCRRGPLSESERKALRESVLKVYEGNCESDDESGQVRLPRVLSIDESSDESDGESDCPGNSCRSQDGDQEGP